MAIPSVIASISGSGHSVSYPASALTPTKTIYLLATASESPTEYEWSVLPEDPDLRGGHPLDSNVDVGTNMDFVGGKSSVQNPSCSLDVTGGYCFSLRASGSDGWSDPGYFVDGTGSQAIVYILTDTNIKLPAENMYRYSDDLNDTLYLISTSSSLPSLPIYTDGVLTSSFTGIDLLAPLTASMSGSIAQVSLTYPLTASAAMTVNQGVTSSATWDELKQLKMTIATVSPDDRLEISGFLIGYNTPSAGNMVTSYSVDSGSRETVWVASHYSGFWVSNSFTTIHTGSLATGSHVINFYGIGERFTYYGAGNWVTWPVATTNHVSVRRIRY